MEQCYINLTIVKESQGTEVVTMSSEAGKQSSPFSRVARLNVEHSDNDQVIPLQALFDPRKIHSEEARRPSRIFIRGRAGMGKTTLCKKIVHQFTHRKIWQCEFCRVLWIPLMNLKLKERCQVAGYNLRHLLSHEIFTESPKMEMLVDVLWQDLVATRSGNTLFILDGLDEVSDDLEGDMQRFLEGLLNWPNVIITSRPHAILPPRVDSTDLEVETIGFYPEQVTEYISKTFSDMPNIGANVDSILQDHQLMQDLVRIPVQLDALCYIWKDLGDQPIPQTMTAIYQTIEKNLWRKDGVKLGRFRSTQTVSRRALEAYMLDERHLLEAMVFTGMYTNTVEFTQDHQDKLFDEVLEAKTYILDDGLSQLSFLRTSNPSSRSEDRRYHFIHLTYQEYFAARYFVRQWMHKTQLFCCNWSKRREEVSPYDFIRKYTYDIRYDMMWRFVAGLSSYEDGQKTRFFETIEQEPRDLLGPAHHRLIMRCLGEVVSTADSPFLAFRTSIEDSLSRWVLVECERTSRSLLAEESELSDRALESVFAKVLTR
jgi:NACHT/LRR/PYD domain-containing protein 3